MDVEILIAPEMADRGSRMLIAMAEAAAASGVNPIVTAKWRRRAPVLMVYGPGHPVRRPWLLEHLKRGGRVVAWDLGYWMRDTPGAFNMRLTIDADHPHDQIIPEPPERFDAAGIALREDFEPGGPIILCGMGIKQRRMRGNDSRQWEVAALERIRRQYPKRQVLYHPKRPESGLHRTQAAMGRIEDVLKSASLVVCCHSNVAVDACIAGVPVDCEDGAALALYRNNPAPSRAERLEFLRSLAWWQFNPTEATLAWSVILRRLSASTSEPATS